MDGCRVSIRRRPRGPLIVSTQFDFALGSSTALVGEFAGGVVGDAAEHVGEPGLGIDAVEPGGGDEGVDGGGALATIEDELATYLLDRALPDTALVIEAGVVAPFGGALQLALKEGYAQDAALTAAVRAVLEERFGLKSRALGRTLFVTEIVAAVEALEQVESVLFTLAPLWSGAGPRLTTSAAGAVQAVVPDARTTVVLADAADISITYAGGAA